MNQFEVYILFSSSLKKFYTGSTENLEKRVQYHNLGGVKFTSTGIPWKLVWHKSCNTRAEAVQLENKVKKRGAKRFLLDLGFIDG